MTELKRVMIKNYGEEEASAELDMACENIRYDMRNGMSLQRAITRALNDIYMEPDYSGDMISEYQEWCSNNPADEDEMSEEEEFASSWAGELASIFAI